MPINDDDQALLDWLQQFRFAATSNSGWIRAVRRQCNMQSKQLAQKMRVSPARISVLERDEQRGAVTLKMMQKAAAALDCVFVYAFIPNTGASVSKPRIRLDSAYMGTGKESRGSEPRYRGQRGRKKTVQD